MNEIDGVHCYEKSYGRSKEKRNPDEPQLEISSEQLNMVMGRRNDGDSYPEAYIDRKAWQPFIDTGFTEWRKTRVLYKETV